MDLVVEKGFDAQYGARSLKRAIREQVEDVLCDFMMEHPEPAALEASVADDKVVLMPADA